MRQRLGTQIQQATASSGVSEAFLAALISLENAPMKASATRFEPHVLRRLRLVQLGLGYVSRGKWRRDYNGITRVDLKGLSSPQLRLLATSFGYTQIMGWWSIPLKVTVESLQNPSTHLPIAVRLLERVAGVGRQDGQNFLKLGDFAAAFRIWNSGSPTGKTHDPKYVERGLAVLDAYRALL